MSRKVNLHWAVTVIFDGLDLNLSPTHGGQRAQRMRANRKFETKLNSGLRCDLQKVLRGASLGRSKCKIDAMAECRRAEAGRRVFDKCLATSSRSLMQQYSPTKSSWNQRSSSFERDETRSILKRGEGNNATKEQIRPLGVQGWSNPRRLKGLRTRETIQRQKRWTGRCKGCC